MGAVGFGVVNWLRARLGIFISVAISTVTSVVVPGVILAVTPMVALITKLPFHHAVSGSCTRLHQVANSLLLFS